MGARGRFVRLTLLSVAAAFALAAAEGPAPAAIGGLEPRVALLLDPPPPAVGSGSTGTSDGVSTACSSSPCADLSLTAVQSPRSIVAGEEFNYLFTITNHGPGEADGVTLADPLPPNLSLAEVLFSQGTCSATTNMTCALGRLSAGASATVIVIGTPVGAVSAVTNSANVQASTPDPDPTDNTASTTGVVTSPSGSLRPVHDDLAVRNGTAMESFTAEGAELTYSVIVANILRAATTQPTLDVELPADATYVPADSTSGCALAGSGASVHCALPSIAGGGQTSVSIAVRVARAGTFSARFTAFDPDDQDLRNNQMALAAPVDGVDLTLSKTATPNPVGLGATLTYRLRVANRSSTDAGGVTVRDALPEGVSLVSTSATQGSCNNTAALVCSLGTLGAGAEATVSVVVTAPNIVARLSNTATVFSHAHELTPRDNTDTAVTDVFPVADLALAKRVAPARTTVGRTFVYTLSVTNRGPNDAPATVRDSLPSRVSLVSASATQGSCSGTTTLVCFVGTVPAGKTAAVTVVARAETPGDATNSASVSIPNDSELAFAFDPNPDNNSTSIPAFVDSTVANADVSIAQTAAPDPVNVGGSITYTLSVHNGGPAPAADVVVTDALPGAVELIAAASSQGSCTGTPTVTCRLGALGVGQSATVTIRARAIAAGTVANSASLTSSTVDPNRSNNFTSTSTTATSADLSVTIDDSPDPVSVGRQLTYTVAVRNLGPSSAQGVTVSDPLPPETTLVSATAGRGSCGVAATVTCALGELAVGEHAAVTLVVRPGTAGTVKNAVTVTSTTHDPVASNDTAAADTRALSADLSLAMRAAPRLVNVGAPLTYTLEVANAGPTEARDVHVRDALPDDLELRSTTPSRGTCTGEADLDCSLGALAQGDTATVRVVAAPVRAGTIVNTATVAGSDLDPREANNQAVVRAVAASADVAITMRAGAGRARVGMPLAYTLNVRNLGPSEAHGVRVADELPAGAELASVRTDAGTCRSRARVACDVGALAPGEAATVRVTVRPRVPGGLTNTAEVSATEHDPDRGNNRASVTTPAQRLPHLLLSPTLGPPRTVTSVIGVDFPPRALVTLRWRPGTGTATVQADPNGRFRARMLVLPHDTLGARLLVASALAAGAAPLRTSAPFLVVPGRLQPQDFLERG